MRPVGVKFGVIIPSVIMLAINSGIYVAIVLKMTKLKARIGKLWKKDWKENTVSAEAESLCSSLKSSEYFKRNLRVLFIWQLLLGLPWVIFHLFFYFLTNFSLKFFAFYRFLNYSPSFL